MLPAIFYVILEIFIFSPVNFKQKTCLTKIFLELTKLKLESGSMSTNNHFARILHEIGSQLNELDCPANTITYLSFLRSPPLNLDQLTLNFVSHTDPSKLSFNFPLLIQLI
jgi:hypothetical protein